MTKTKKKTSKASRYLFIREKENLMDALTLVKVPNDYTDEEMFQEVCKKIKFLNKNLVYDAHEMSENEANKFFLQKRIDDFNKFGTEKWGDTWYQVNRTIVNAFRTVDFIDINDLKVKEFGIVLANRLLHLLKPLEKDLPDTDH